MEPNQEKRFAFNDDKVRAIARPDKGRSHYCDERMPGLELVVTHTGTKTFYVSYSQDNRHVRIRLGRFPALTITRARKAAAEKIGRRAAGHDLIAEREKSRKESTLKELFDHWLEIHAKPRKRTWPDDERMFNKYLADWHGHRLASIGVADVVAWHAKIGREHGRTQANRCKALLATLFNKAYEVGFNGNNPCKPVANFPEQSRERFLHPNEMKAFFTALAAEDEIWRHFFLVALFTGARRGNVASMAWSELDLDGAVWHVPPEKTKNKKPTAIVLCPPAMAILEARRQNALSQVWVFPSGRTDSHVIDPRKSWERITGEMRHCPKCKELVGQGEVIDKKAKAKNRKYRCPKCRVDLSENPRVDLHIHDLRRSLGSWQAALGASLVVIGKSLGHADLKSTQVYSRLQVDPIKESVGKAAQAMLDASGSTALALLGVSPGAVGIDKEQENGKI